MEKWIKIREGYEVSNYSRVRTMRGKTPKIMGQSDLNGYCAANINKIPTLVHRLVAEAFILNTENKPHINHINGDRKDNLPENLEWVTPQENVDHSIRTGLSNSSVVSKRKPVAQYDLDGNLIATYESIHEASIKMDAKGQHGNIRKVCKGERKHFKGYHWKFI